MMVGIHGNSHDTNWKKEIGKEVEHWGLLLEKTKLTQTNKIIEIMSYEK